MQSCRSLCACKAPRAEESCANCSWTEIVLAIAIQLFNANKFLGSLFYSHLTFIQAEPEVKDGYRQRDTEVQQMGNSAILGPTHYLFLPGSTAKAAQALPLPKLTTSEPYSKKNPPSRGRGIRLAGIVCFYTCTCECCTRECQTSEDKCKVTLKEPSWGAAKHQDGSGY